MNSGPGGAVKIGSWDGLSLPVIGWRVWFSDGSSASSGQREWSELPRGGCLAVVVYHSEGRRTRMISSDWYPPPPGVGGHLIEGEQLGEVNSLEWRRARERINREAAEGLSSPEATNSRPRSRR